MLPRHGGVGAAPRLALLHPGHTDGGAGVVDDAEVPEGEDAGLAREGGAGGRGEGLGRAGGELGVLTVPPVVDDDGAVGVELGGTPGGGGAGVGALVVLHLLVGEGEHTEASLRGEARVGHPAAHTGQGTPREVEGAALGQ